MPEIFWNDYGMFKYKGKKRPPWWKRLITWFKQKFIRNKARDMYLRW